MPLGKEAREVMNNKEAQIVALREQGWSDAEISALVGMSRQGVWEARKRFHKRTGEKSAKTLDNYNNRMYNSRNT